MFILFEYTVIVVLTAVVATVLFAVSAAFLMVAAGFAVALRRLRRTRNTMNTINEGSGMQSPAEHANARVPSLISNARSS
jgi:hypothetical protein